jgi:signal transduction histidine kinase
MRPLNRLGSIKLKMSVLILAAVGVTAGVAVAGEQAGLPVLVAGLCGIALALLLVHLLARGLTSPLREMAAAARAMAGGEHGRQVSVRTRDEVGELALAFNRMSAELEGVDRMRRDLVANAAHELRTPLSALRARLENMVDGVEPADAATLRSALAQVERLGRLVEQLLDLSRLEAEGMTLDAREFSVRPLLDRVADEARLGADGSVELEVTAAAGLRATGDPERIHQVVGNLVENALRHSPPGGKVTIGAERREDAMAIEVRDAGPGIPAGESDRVFERFYRADAARSGDGGSGLGLAIVRWIVELHGGEVRAERAEPTGCRMVVTLPAALHSP